MTDVVAAQLVVGGFPAAEGCGARGEACVAAEVVQEAIDVLTEDEAAIDLGGVEHRAGAQPDARQREGSDPRASDGGAGDGVQPVPGQGAGAQGCEEVASAHGSSLGQIT